MKTQTAIITIFCLLAICGSARPGEPLEGLISHWTFDEGQGTTAYDSVGSNHGTIYGAGWTAGQIDTALRFDGPYVLDYVHVGDKDNLDFGTSTDFTVTAWFTTLSARAQMIVNKRAAGQQPGYDIYPNNSNILARLGDGVSTVTARSTDQLLNDGRWHHVAAVFDRSDVITVYIDGEVKATSGQLTELGNTDTIQPFVVGARINSGTPLRLTGSIDDVRVYGRALSGEEVLQLYQATLIQVVGLQITGPDNVIENSSAQYTATAYFEDGSTKDVSHMAIWSVEPQTYASIDNNGLLNTGHIDTADQITIYAQFTKGDVTVNAEKTVGISLLTDLQITGPAKVRENYQAQFNAAASYEDASTADVTTSAIWFVEPTHVATIDENGLLTTQRIETAQDFTVYAQYTATGLTLQGQMTVQVSLPLGLEITGPENLPANFHTQFNATVSYEDDTTADVTTSGIWSVEPPDIATIDDNGLLNTADVNEPQDITIYAQYTAAATAVEAQLAAQVLPPNVLQVPAQYETIQAAIDAALDGDVVLVADGTYTGGGHSGIDFRGKAITVRSENGPENCIIDCQNSHQGFRFTSGENQNSVLDGLTITNGYHGIYCKGSSPVIRNCNITGNPGGEHGGGIFCSSGSLTIENCTITGNSAGRGGGIYCYGGSLTINNCTISCNTADYDDGGGIYYRSSRDYDNTLTITNSIITANSARSEGGGIYCRNTGGTAEITNCAITGNSAGSSGAGIYCYTYGTAVFANCTIAGNSADYSSGGIYCTSRSSAEINNSILWDNSPRQITFYGHDSTISVAYSDVQDGPNGIYVGESSMLNWGEGNIDLDPCFVQPGYWDCCWVGGDYHLLPTSPCIDAGIDAGLYTDIEDNNRPFDFPDVDNNGSLPDFDIGAYEAIVLPAHVFAVDSIKNVINEKVEFLELIDQFLDMQWQAYDALEELLQSRDYTDVAKSDIISAKQKIFSGIQHHEQSADAFEKGIDKLQDSLTTLTSESEPDYQWR